jgi:phage/plasmid primase-like uncharacterized protein
MGDFPDFERGHIVGARLAGTSLIKLPQSVSFIRFCWQIRRIMGRRYQRGGAVVENQHWQKEKRIVSENRGTTAAQMTGQQN